MKRKLKTYGLTSPTGFGHNRLTSARPGCGRPLCANFGIKASKSEKLRYLLYSGWSVRGTGEGLDLADNAFAGYCYNGRLLLEGEKAVLKFDDNGSPAALIPPQYGGG